MTERADPTPVALCARVSSERHDVDLSVSAQLRALRDYAAKNGHLIAREYVDEAESGRVADRPQFRRMLDEATGPNAPLLSGTGTWSQRSPSALATVPSRKSPSRDGASGAGAHSEKEPIRGVPSPA